MKLLQARCLPAFRLLIPEQDANQQDGKKQDERNAEYLFHRLPSPFLDFI